MRFSLKSKNANFSNLFVLPSNNYLIVSHYFQITYLFRVLCQTLEIKPIIFFLTPFEALRIKIRIENSNIMRFKSNAFFSENALLSNGVLRLIFGLRL